MTVPDGFLGVDLGIANIATTSTGSRHCGKALNAVRHRQRELRRRLQAKQTKSAKRLLKKRRRAEARFATNTNHVIAKQIVTEAERTGNGIALEDLQGIRDRVRLRKPQRVTLHSWSFHQLGGFLGYKAARAGVAVIYVDPAFTSQQCSSCGHVERGNRLDQASFVYVVRLRRACRRQRSPQHRRARCGGLGSESRCLTRTGPSTPSTARSCKLGRLFTAEKLTLLGARRRRGSCIRSSPGRE